MTIALYDILVLFHILLFVFWLGADLGVAIAGSHFRDRSNTVEQRLSILKLLVATDMGPRSAWALMIASTISLLKVGQYWDVPNWGVALAWAISLFWLWLVWAAHKAGQTPKAAKLRKIEMVLKWLLAGFYLALGTVSLMQGEPIVFKWLAVKSLTFGFIFIAAIMIDIKFKPVGPLLMKLIEQGSGGPVEEPLLKTMNKSRLWVRITYVLLVIMALLGTTKPF